MRLSSATLSIKAASGVFPNIAHTVNVAIDRTLPVGPIPGGMVLIPAGSFEMGNSMDPAEGATSELPVHAVCVSTFYMDRYEVTNQLWNDVRAWGLSHGYSDLPPAYGGNNFYNKGSTHPVNLVSWWDVVKWNNARSERDNLLPAYYTNDARTTIYKTGNVYVTNAQVKWSGNGYRLPTEAEWERAARGGAAGHRFPWSNVETIDHTQATYYSYRSGGSHTFGYDVSPNVGYNPTYAVGNTPYTSPVGSLAANNYGLYDMAGNVWEWCWDWYDAYSSLPSTDPQGPPYTNAGRVLRGGHWVSSAQNCRAATRGANGSSSATVEFGFRSVRR